MKVLLILTIFLPWAIRRRVLIACLGYELHPTSRIGFSWVYPRKLVLEEHAQIGHLTVCKSLEFVHLKAHATVGRGNWISGFPKGGKHFTHQTEREPQLILGEHAAITHRHIIDCTHSVEIGRFSTVAGYRTQILTHSIDLAESRQHSMPVKVGEYCFVGTQCVLLGGAVLPSYSVLGANSLLREGFDQAYALYAGSPARQIKELPKDLLYFVRPTGFVS
jgi:acetyltransferase-like isoleucine patch superfamily enzyme